MKPILVPVYKNQCAANSAPKGIGDVSKYVQVTKWVPESTDFFVSEIVLFFDLN